MRIHVKIAALTASASILVSAAAEAQSIKAARVATGFLNPVLAVSPPGDYRRLFIVEENAARIRILDIQDGTVKPAPFLSLAGKVATGGEQGLLGLAFHPSYALNGKFYVNYTDTGGDTVVECYQVSATNPDIADPTPVGTIIGPIFQPQSNHNGGMIAFGPDGLLYIGMGDGGNFNDQGFGHAPGGNAQSPDTLLGKMLRLDVDIPFPHIPPSNPYVGVPGVLDEIWAFGMRNPWRFSFDRVQGAMYIGDVGQDAREEIDYEAPGSPGGLNYGWRCMEGLLCTFLSGCECNSPALTLPIDSYTTGASCAVIGGYVYNGCAIPSLTGTYFYADHCSTRIWSFTYDGAVKTPTVERTTELEPAGTPTIQGIAGFGEDSYGEVYILDHSDGEIYKIVSAAPFPDCNGNNIDDTCEIAVGGVPDVNGNGIPDECECSPVAYCTAKAGLTCGTPAISSFGSSSASATSGFFVIAGPARSNRSGLLLYTNAGRDAQPFQGGILCLKTPPLRRGPAVNSGGTSTCDGEFSLDVNAFAAGLAGGNPDPFLSIPGTQVNIQWWGRDSVATGAFLSNAGEYLVCP